MFWIFKILPTWIWPGLVLVGLVLLALSYLPRFLGTAKSFKILGAAIVVVGIFINGMIYADNAWKQAAAELQAKVAEADAKSAATNEVIKERVVNKIQIVKVRGDETTQYIDREVVKYDHTCVIPPEFVSAHNRAAEQPK